MRGAGARARAFCASHGAPPSGAWTSRCVPAVVRGGAVGVGLVRPCRWSTGMPRHVHVAGGRGCAVGGRVQDAVWRATRGPPSWGGRGRACPWTCRTRTRGRVHVRDRWLRSPGGRWGWCGMRVCAWRRLQRLPVSCFGGVVGASWRAVNVSHGCVPPCAHRGWVVTRAGRLAGGVRRAGGVVVVLVPPATAPLDPGRRLTRPAVRPSHRPRGRAPWGKPPPCGCCTPPPVFRARCTRATPRRWGGWRAPPAAHRWTWGTRRRRHRRPTDVWRPRLHWWRCA